MGVDTEVVDDANTSSHRKVWLRWLLPPPIPENDDHSLRGVYVDHLAHFITHQRGKSTGRSTRSKRNGPPQYQQHQRC